MNPAAIPAAPSPARSFAAPRLAAGQLAILLAAAALLAAVAPAAAAQIISPPERVIASGTFPVPWRDRVEPVAGDPFDAAGAAAEAAAWRTAAAWPEPHRAFLQDGAGWLLSESEREALLAMDHPERTAWIDRFLALPAVPAAIEARRATAFTAVPSVTDIRARLLFLHGPPTRRLVPDCVFALQPLEIWTWGDPEAPQEAGRVHSLVVYRDPATERWRLWLPQHGKSSLYTEEMIGWLEVWESLPGNVRGRRFDLRACPEARDLDRVTGIRGFADGNRDRPRPEDYLAWLTPPADVVAWAHAVLAAPPAAPPPLPLEGITVLFPAVDGQRTVSRFVVAVPPGVAMPAPAEEGEGGEGEAPELRLVVEGVVEREAAVLETFRLRFQPEAPTAERPLVLVADRALRPDADYVVRLAVRDEVSGAVAHLARGFRVPSEARPDDAAPFGFAVAAATDSDAAPVVPTADRILLLPPEESVVLGLWRAEALIAGERIARVEFLVDGEVQLSRTRPPFTAELRLDRFPREQVIAAAGYDAAGELVAADEVVVNQPQGELRVRLVEPARGATVAGRTLARAEVTVPAGRRIERLEIRVNEEPATVVERPPWQAEIEVPEGDGAVYLSAVAWLDDGSRAEDVRVLNAPGFSEEVDVAVVDLYVAAVDRQHRPVPGLSVGDFRVLEDGRPQEVRRFEEVVDLPLGVGLVLDVSGSMQGSLAEVREAADAFLRRVVRPGDKAFAVAFADRPSLVVAPTDDVDLLADALAGLRAFGATALHDAVMTSLYHFRGVEGQKALVLFTDGDDTSSAVKYEDALEYARRMDVAVYTIGFGIGRADLPLRRKLDELASSTGGRSFYARDAGELAAAYDQIELDLRSRYLLTYAPDRQERGDEYRRVEVEVTRPGVTGRTIRGYYP